MKKMLSVLATAFLAVGSSSQAAVYFQNTGVLSGWSSTEAQRAGSVTQVSSPVYKTTTSLRCRQIYQTSDGNRYHAEASLHDAQNNGTDRYYGQAMYIQNTWPKGEVGVVQQWATNDPSGPWFGMDFDGESLLWDAVRGPQSSGDPRAFAVISKGAWHRVIVRVNAKTSGNMEVWIDGSRKLSLSGDWSTNYAGGSSIRWSTGIYLGWHSHAPVGSGDLSVWHDQFRIAGSPYDADPVHW